MSEELQVPVMEGITAEDAAFMDDLCEGFEGSELSIDENGVIIKIPELVMGDDFTVLSNRMLKIMQRYGKDYPHTRRCSIDNDNGFYIYLSKTKKEEV